MTPQEAIGKVHCCMHIGNDRILKARDMAIKALEKQIPKKVKNKKVELFVDIGKCPYCGGKIAKMTNEYFCGNENCGQALDWS